MARALSQDLRDRVVSSIEGGLSCRRAAARFGVGIATAIRWRQLALCHGRAIGGAREARLVGLSGFATILNESQLCLSRRPKAACRQSAQLSSESDRSTSDRFQENQNLR